MSAPLKADAEAIGNFAEAMFRYVDDGGWVSLRTFYHDERRRPLIRAIRMNGDGVATLVRMATSEATKAANLPDPAVFCPPVATFSSRKSAAEGDLAEGVALSVELDARPAESRTQLEGLLGHATVIVASGGTWTDPATGELQDKLHAHWRLSEPARGADEHGKLKRARRAATLLVGADASAVPIVHPLRWPGSWHRKDEPKLATIAGIDREAEIHLDDAVEALESACLAMGLDLDTGTTRKRDGRPLDQDDDLTALADAVPNDDLPWDEWNKVGMAFHAASNGSGEGLAAFLRWSAKSAKHDEAAAAARWRHIAKYPPSRVTAASLIWRARRAIEGWRLPSWDKAAAEGQAAPNEEPEPKDKRLQVKLGDAWINDSTRKCARLLADELYMRGKVPAVLLRVEDVMGAVDVVDDEAEPGVMVGDVRHARGSLIFDEPSPERVQYRLDERALFLRYDKRSDEWVPKACPPDIARRLVGNASALGFRSCAGVVTVPLFINGRIVADRGYHAPTRLLLEPPAGLPAIPDRPTKEDAQVALAVLLRPFKGYLERIDCTENQRLHSAFAAAALTAVLRPSLPTAPAIVLDANVPGAGKGKAARALAVIATGTYPAVISEGHSDEETEKRIAAVILSGVPAFVLDNLQRTLAASTIESGLTEGVATIRQFGKLSDLTVPCSALVTITANNAALRADMLRRSLPVRIVVDDDEPERRSFKFDPYTEAKAHRREILTAGLTIARAWWLARETDQGRAIRKTTLGSFEEWADLVAGAVEWLIGMNPVALIGERKAQDPRRGDERAVVEKLFDHFGESEWTAGEGAVALESEVWRTILRVKGDKATGHEIGNWLRSRKDATFGRFALRHRLNTALNTSRWRVQEIPGHTGHTGT